MKSYPDTDYSNIADHEGSEFQGISKIYLSKFKCWPPIALPPLEITSCNICFEKWVPNWVPGTISGTVTYVTYGLPRVSTLISHWNPNLSDW